MKVAKEQSWNDAGSRSMGTGAREQEDTMGATREKEKERERENHPKVYLSSPLQLSINSSQWLIYQGRQNQRAPRRYHDVVPCDS